MHNFNTSRNFNYNGYMVFLCKLRGKFSPSQFVTQARSPVPATAAI
jgi:hypothetical protein